MSARRCSGTGKTPSKWTPAGPSRRRSIPAVQGNPRVDSTRGPDARALRPRHAAAARGWTSSAGGASIRTFWPRTLGAGRQRGRRVQARGEAQRGRHLSRRAQRHGYRERADGRGAASGTTVLRNAASEPHVQDLARFSRFSRRPPSTASAATRSRSRGRPALTAAPYTVGPDHIEIGSFIGLAAVTGGAITIDGVRGDDLRSTLLAFERLGVRPGLTAPN